MKNLLSLSFFFICLSLFLSCGGDDDDGIDGADAGTGTLTAQIDNTSFRAENDRVVFAEGTTNGGGFGITATASDGRSIDIAFGGIPNSNTTYTTDNAVLTFTYKPSATATTNLYSAVQGFGDGELQLSTFNDDQAKGTFSFRGIRLDLGTGMADTIVVSAGSFDIDR